jgi:hypothetical protein
VLELTFQRFTEMDPLAPYCRWLGKKMTVLDQSLAKIESGAPSCLLPFSGFR